MAADSDSQIVESPITAAKVTAAIDAARAAVGLSGPIIMTALAQGRGLVVSCTAPAYT